MTYTDALAAGKKAVTDGRWPEAREHYRAALALQDTAEAHEGLAEALWWSHDPESIDHREKAYTYYRQRGDKLSAARMATGIGMDNFEFRGDAAVAAGWFQRARRLLEGAEDSLEFGWLAVWEGHGVLMAANDTQFARARAVVAADIGRKHGAIDLEMLAIALEGLALVSGGDVEEGMKRLDEGCAAVTAGELSDRNAIVTALCYLMDACDRVRDYDRAAQWCARAQEIARSVQFEEVMAVCRPHYAVVLMWRGEWQEAENQLDIANDLVMKFRPAMAVEGLVRMAELRWRQGRWDEAETLFERVKTAELSQLGRAELAMAKGDTAEAIDLAQRYLRRIPENDRIERAFGLEVMVRALVAAGRPDDAVEHSTELGEIADRVRTEPMRAAAALAAGVIAASIGDHEAARMCLEDATDFYERHGAPFESARARLELAKSLGALGRADAGARCARAALETFQKMGATREAERAVRVLRQIDPLSVKMIAAQDEAGLTSREVEVLRLIATAKSNQEIAADLVLSIRTVERHISTIYEKIGATGKAARAAATAYAVRHGL